MNKQNIVPVVGIALLVLTMAAGAAKDRNKTTQVTVPPALPAITSKTQPMTLDELYVRCRKAFESEAPGSYYLDMDKDAGIFAATVWTTGMNADVPNTALKYLDYKRKWDANLAEMCELCGQIQEQFDNHGHQEISVVIRLVNCDDDAQVFAVAERGDLIYDIVAATPAGERVPDPSVRSVSDELNTYVFNSSTGVVHRPGCSYAQKISADHREELSCTRDELLTRGWNLCDYCKP